MFGLGLGGTAGDSGAQVVAVIEALRNVVITTARSGPPTTVPDTCAGWAEVAEVVGRHLGTGGDPARTWELVPTRRAGDRGLDLPRGAGVQRRRIVFTGNPGVVASGVDPALPDATRVVGHAFPWSVLAVRDSLMVVRDEAAGLFRVVTGARELTNTVTLLHDALWAALPRVAFDADTRVPPRHLRPVLESLADGATDQAAQRQLAMSSRTFNRRTSELLAMLDARSRFQAGVEAARRRWV
ncbi:hypothetical protein V5P93_005058 [Actinokineospora auranticolor]|uniref:HTH luxR-type domain-containing protein n=1 Tax=Actinokineospora auranticolor TaxID=155976 RepID=A0A2S6GKA5_9PSEU|nr:hypothetical protein [Actinokineospora auranticolor]PPK65586.1 hypothetical protein CLV40_11370 [Actinokineospora auranticolor]